MRPVITRRAFGVAAAATLATPFISRTEAAAPIELRCSLDTAPSHPRNVAFRDFLGKIEAASGGKIKTKLFESGSLFPDLHVVKALVQGQVEMCCPGTWTVTGFVPDADFSQLPALYGLPIDTVHKATDGSAGKFVNDEVSKRLHVDLLGGWFDLGFNNWFSTKKDLKSLDSLKGMKLRSPGGILNSYRIRFFGGIPNVTAWPDVPLALSQGTFDGLISTDESVNSSKLFDSGVRHTLQDHQGMGLYVPMMNQAFAQKIGPKMKDEILKIWSENLPTWRANTAKSQDHGLEELKKHGVEVVYVSDADRKDVRAKLLKGQDKAAQEAHMSPKLVKLVMADIGA